MYLYILVYVIKLVLQLNDIGFVTCTYHSYNLAHIKLKGYSSQKLIDFLLNLFCITYVTVYLSACNFAIMHLYKEIKFKNVRKMAKIRK